MILNGNRAQAELFSDTRDEVLASVKFKAASFPSLSPSFICALPLLSCSCVLCSAVYPYPPHKGLTLLFYSFDSKQAYRTPFAGASAFWKNNLKERKRLSLWSGQNEEGQVDPQRCTGAEAQHEYCFRSYSGTKQMLSEIITFTMKCSLHHDLQGNMKPDVDAAFTTWLCELLKGRIVGLIPFWTPNTESDTSWTQSIMNWMNKWIHKE